MGYGPPVFKKATMAKFKRRIKIWAERHALAIVARFALTIIWPMVAIGVAMLALAALIVLIAAIPDVPVPVA